MTVTLLIVIVAAALVCPLYMLWEMRRGKRAACCPPREACEIAALRERQRVLAAQLDRASYPDEPAQRRRDASVQR
ncbi:MAG TPA: hypothetical protein VGR11_08615 [Solirubrobacteraceae bacterium]|nr:hypothetical protein [Solirubrobacteraceae bacterium]